MCGKTRIIAFKLVLPPCCKTGRQRACPFLLHGSSLPFSDHPLQPLNRSCKIQDVLGKAELLLQQFSLRVDYFTRKQSGLFSEFKCSYNDHTYYHTSFFFLPLLSPFKDFCLKNRSIFSYAYAMCSYPCFFLLSKRNCFLLFLLLERFSLDCRKGLVLVLLRPLVG